ncbi:unnamed protein product [Mytilus edulis]|uniref:OTU domain-containing protein n=1 Tax=Mytilus edulis TaxID=6550 RepID=A0A8S3PZ90_MYTED|nr:unnamed protein product [Mytilus edulis]
MQLEQSVSSINCPIQLDQSVTSINCPILLDQSVTSINCPILLDQSVTSINCPILLDQSVNSINCPIQLDQSVNSINCPILLDQSVNSINCPIKQDESINSINCLMKQDQSVNSINCPIKLDQSVNSINCPIKQDQSFNSLNCPTNNDQSINSLNCPTNNDQSVDSLNCPYNNESINSTETIVSKESTKLNLSIKSESQQSVKSELKQSIKSIQLNKSMKSNVGSESFISNLDIKSTKTKMHNESMKTNLDYDSVNTSMDYEWIKTNMDYVSMKTNMDNESMKTDLDVESMKSMISKQSSKIKHNLSNLNDAIQLDTNFNKEHMNSHEFLDKTESMAIETENIQLDCNDFSECKQENDKLKLYSHRNRRNISEDSIEVRSVFDNWVVQGSFHQGDTRFGIDSGKQCVANCLSALPIVKIKDLNDWDPMYLDNVLIDGNEIYRNIHGNNTHLLVSDLPGMIDMSGKLLEISRKESITAVVDTSGTTDFSAFGNSLPLDQALQESLIDYDACFICAYDTTFLALKHNQELLLFDSHARNELGLKDSDGKSLLLKLNSLDHLYQYCCNMIAGASQDQWFEVTGVSISIFGQQPIIKTNSELSESHTQINTSELKLSEILQTGNKDSHELPKTQENITLNDNISPEIIELNINKSIGIDKINEVHINEVIMNDESDIEILSSAEIFYDFIPLYTLLKRKLCKIINIPSKYISKQNSSNSYKIGPPIACKTITGDGNCLFRAISYSLSSRQEYFGKVRRAIVDHLMRNAEIFRSFLQPRFKTVEEHIQTLKMVENNTWGTELEILACADLLKTDIYTFFNNSWIKYSSSQICSNNNVNDQAIYLQHNGDINHYEVVTAVTQESISLNGSQSRQEHWKKYQNSKSEVPTKKMKIDENQMTDSDNKIKVGKTESKVFSKN